MRRDLIPSLPLPRRMVDYLNTPHYYSEHLVEDTEEHECGRRYDIPSRGMQVQPENDGIRSNYILMENGADNIRQS